MSISEKKFKEEVSKRDNIISQLRQDRNKMIIKYQKLNQDLLNIFQQIEELINKSNDEQLIKQLKELKDKFKDHF